MNKKSLVNPSNGHEIRNASGRSAYFQGRYQDYGRYAWNIKYYSFDSEFEIEDTQRWAFGEHVQLKGTCDCKGYESCSLPRPNARGFEALSELLGRPIESYTAGRSAGWLVIETELTEEELNKVDAHVAECMAALPGFLKDEREYRASEAREADQQEEADRAMLAESETLKQACTLIKGLAGCDAVILVKGISIDVSTGTPVKGE